MLKIRSLLLAITIAGLGAPCWAQQGPMTPAPAFSGAPVNRSTLNSSAVIAAGGTFQTVLASNFNTAVQRQALTIQNNNTSTDNCWIFLGSGSATVARSILLTPGGSYQRYWPFVPSDAIQATCASNGDTLYVDAQ